MAKESFPFILVPSLIAMILAYLQFWPIALVFVLIAAFMAYFFRDPHRNIPTESGIIISPADGRVTRVDVEPGSKTVSIFLSPLDVHINRSPISGTVTDIAYVKGRKAPATSDEASISNERNSLTISNEQITVVCTQIAGIVARRIVCWSKVNDKLSAGERFGLIKFSSRTDLKMPNAVEVKVKVGDRVKGGETIIARIAN